jgi:hypothetical protein
MPWVRALPSAGGWPRGWQDLVNLASLSLDGNKLAFGLPPASSMPPKLEALTLSGNLITGERLWWWQVLSAYPCSVAAPAWPWTVCHRPAYRFPGHCGTAPTCLLTIFQEEPRVHLAAAHDSA